jgi:hypothetical protein
MMNVHHLLEDEVDYELRIRKVVVGATETVTNKQRLLRAALRPVSGAEQQISITMEEDPETEYFIVTEKMKFITTILEASGAKAKEFATLEGRMIHLFYRLDRIHPKANNSRKFDITVAMSAIKRLLRMYFPKSSFTEEKNTQANKLDAKTGAVNKEVTPQKNVDQLPETNDVRDQLDVGEELPVQHSLNAAVPPALQVDNLAKLSEKDKEKYLQALRTVRHITAKVKDWKLLANIENFDNSMELTEQERLKVFRQAESEHLETEDEEGAMGGRHGWETTRSVHSMTKNRSKTGHKISEYEQKLQDANVNVRSQPNSNKPRIRQAVNRSFSEFTSTRPRHRGNSRRKSLSVHFNTGNSEHQRRESSSETMSSESENDRSSVTSSESELRSSTSRSRSRRTANNDDSRQLPISRWGVKFSGDDNVTLIDFLRQVAMLANSEQVTEDSLLKKAGHLLKGTALEWYMSSAHRFKKWKHLVRGLKEAFLPEDNDYFVLQECERRQQLKSETFEIYLAKMNRLFDGLSYVISEKSKLSILKQNIKPAHKIGIAMLDIRSVEDLRRYCRRLDGLDPSLYMKSQAAAVHRPNFNLRPQICELEPVEQTSKKKGRNRKSQANTNTQVFTTRDVCAIENQSVQPQQQVQNQRHTYPRQQNFQRQIPEQRNNNFQPRNRNNNERSFYERRPNRDHQWNQSGPNTTENSPHIRSYPRNHHYGDRSGSSSFMSQQVQSLPNVVRNTNPFLDNWTAELTGQLSGQTPQTSHQQPFQQQQQPFQQQQQPFQQQQQPVQLQQSSQQRRVEPSHQFIAQQRPITTQQQPPSASSSPLCWNCDGRNHNQKNCMAPRRVFCFQCGRKDVYISNCPTCSGNVNQQTDLGARLSW